MPISFSQVPANWRMPLYWVEVDPSMAGLPIVRQPALLVGCMTSIGVAEPEIPKPVGTQATADHFYGQGSELAKMFAAFFANNFAHEVWGLPLREPNGATAADGTVTVQVDADPTKREAGTVHLYIAGHHYPTVVGSSDSAIAIAAAMTDTINEDPNCPVSATRGVAPDDDTITLTCRTKGSTGNDIDVRANYYGKIGGEEYPPGLTLSFGDQTSATGTGNSLGTTSLTVSATTGSPIQVGAAVTGTGVPVGTTIRSQQSGTAGGAGVYITSQQTTLTDAALTFDNPIPKSMKLSGGAGIPLMDNAIANIGETEFEYVSMPYTDSNSLFAWEQEYGFTDTGRWGWMRQHFGHVFSAKRNEYSDLVIWGLTRNAGTTSVMGVEPEAPSPIYEWCTAYTAKAARALTNDPARPLQTLALNKIKSASAEDRWILPELNSLSGVGIATQKTGSDNQPMIMRETTTYQLNLYGQSDDAYELVTTLATLARLLRNQRHAITTKFPRHKLANDGTRFGVGQAIVTPKIIAAELVAQYRIDEFNGLVEDITNFKQHLVVERDPNDPNRVNVLYPPDLVNQLRVFAVLAQFRLQYNRGQDLEITSGLGTGTFQ